MDAGLGIGAGANVVGGLMQSIAASQANKAMADEFTRELQRQQRYRNQAFGTFESALPQMGVETAREQIGQGAEKRQNFFQDVGQTQFGPTENRTKRDRLEYQQSSQARANLGGYSDWALNQMISKIRTQDELNRLSSFAGGTAQVFPYRMQEAQHSWDELAFWGKLIASIGGGAGSFIPNGQGGAQQQQGGYTSAQDPSVAAYNYSPDPYGHQEYLQYLP